MPCESRGRKQFWWHVSICWHINWENLPMCNVYEPDTTQKNYFEVVRITWFALQFLELTVVRSSVSETKDMRVDPKDKAIRYWKEHNRIDELIHQYVTITVTRHCSHACMCTCTQFQFLFWYSVMLTIVYCTLYWMFLYYTNTQILAGSMAPLPSDLP